MGWNVADQPIPSLNATLQVESSRAGVRSEILFFATLDETCSEKSESMSGESRTLRFQGLLLVSTQKRRMSQKSQPKHRFMKKLDSGDYLSLAVWPGKSNPDDEVISVHFNIRTCPPDHPMQFMTKAK